MGTGALLATGMLIGTAFLLKLETATFSNRKYLHRVVGHQMATEDPRVALGILGCCSAGSVYRRYPLSEYYLVVVILGMGRGRPRRPQISDYSLRCCKASRKQSPHKLWRRCISGASPERSTRIDCRPILPLSPLTVVPPRALAPHALRMPLR